MKIVAVICEFNPFHAGHALLFRRVRERFGEDSAIVCVMSGSFVQRGEPAILSKWARAKAATCEGADLVLELPFPYSASSAERFARAGVAIADALGCVDYLAFGSEAGDTEKLFRIAENMESAEFSRAYAEADANKASGTAEKSTLAYERTFGHETTLHTPNNILGVEYIRALLQRKSRILPIAFKREGMAHDETNSIEIGSAMAARQMLYNGEEERVFSMLPSASAAVLREELASGRAVLSPEKFMDDLLLCYRLFDPRKYKSADGLGGGLAHRVYAAAQKACTGQKFFEAIRTKRYTDAFLRRSLLYGILDVTRERLNSPPAYTQVLAFGARGRSILSAARKTASLPILTKPADYKTLSEATKEAAELSYRADSICCALSCEPSSPSDLLRHSPYRKA
ncbi:MAG: nucleotidyltransferase family protein [Clostridia bacterium]|nr:nucleotidyltransferase family protein [Clostridia bacterium]